MGVDTKANLQNRAETVRTEVQEKQNTSQRVGSLFRDMVDTVMNPETIASLYHSVDNVNAFTDALKTKLESINVTVVSPVADISNVTIDKSVVQQGGSISVNWTENDIISNGGTFNIDLYRVGETQPFLSLAKNISEIPYSLTIPNSLPVGSNYKLRVLQSGNASLFAESSTFAVTSQAGTGFSAGSITAARIDNAAGNKLILTTDFQPAAGSIQPEDFIYLKSHARIVYSKSPEWDTSGGAADTQPVITDIGGGSFEIELTLDEHEVPGSTPEIYYFGKMGRMLDNADSSYINTQQVTVTNNVTAYSGSKSVVNLASSASFADLTAAIAANTIIAVERGFNVSATGGQISFDNITGCMLTATGSGIKPRIRFVGSGSGIAIAAYQANYTRIANFEIVVNNMHAGVNWRDGSSWCGLNNTTIKWDETGPDKASTFAHRMYEKSSRVTTAIKQQGNFNFGCNFIGFMNGVFAKLNTADDTWQGHHLAGGLTATPFEMRKFDVYCRQHTADNNAGTQGDAVNFSRGDFNWSYVSNGSIRGWADDAFDSYNTRRLIVEHVTVDQGNIVLNSRGSGNGMKMGGSSSQNLVGGQNIEQGGSADVVFRYNVIKNIRGTESQNMPKAGMHTNSGGDFSGVTIADGGDLNGLTYGKSYAYGNIVYNCDGPGMQLQLGGNSLGANWVIVNNYFQSNNSQNSRQGLWWLEGGSITGLIFDNNILAGLSTSSNTASAENMPGNANIFLDGYPIDPKYTGGIAAQNVLPENIFSTPAAPENGIIVDGSATISAGVVTSTDHPINLVATDPRCMTRDFLGNGVTSAGGLDIGPMQKVGTGVSGSDTSPTGETAEIFEAESGTLGANLSTQSDAGASGGSYVRYDGTNQSTPTDPNLSADSIRTITLETVDLLAGDYIVWLRLRKTSATDDTWYVVVDDQYYYVITANSLTANTWAWTKNLQPVAGSLADSNSDPVFTLAAGKHTIRVIGREPSGQVDQVYITKNGDTPT